MRSSMSGHFAAKRGRRGTSHLVANDGAASTARSEWTNAGCPAIQNQKPRQIAAVLGRRQQQRLDSPASLGLQHLGRLQHRAAVAARSCRRRAKASRTTGGIPLEGFDFPVEKSLDLPAHWPAQVRCVPFNASKRRRIDADLGSHFLARKTEKFSSDCQYSHAQSWCGLIWTVAEKIHDARQHRKVWFSLSEFPVEYRKG